MEQAGCTILPLARGKGSSSSNSNSSSSSSNTISRNNNNSKKRTKHNNDTLSKHSSMKLKDEDVFKIKLALSSLTTSVILCPMVANLYTQSVDDNETWMYFKRGVPGIILHHDSYRIVTTAQLFLADPESGFAIWTENLLETSQYEATQKNFHTFKIGAVSWLKHK